MNDPVRKLSVHQWEDRMGGIPEEYMNRCRFLRRLVPGGIGYLYSPWEYSCRGDTLLRRLKFDSSKECLRLWAFLFSERDRLFLASERGWKIVALMKDLGQTAPLAYAFPELLAFYADELWWAPCFSEEPHLLDEAARLGAGEELCFVRAALGAMVTLDYFPAPDLCIAAVGACCDDFSAVMQLIEGLGHPVRWWEMPQLPAGDPEAYRVFVRGQLRGVVSALEELTGRKATSDMLRCGVDLFSRLRRKTAELRELVYSAERPPLPGLETYLAEFLSIHACSEPDEVFEVLDDLIGLARTRRERDLSPLEAEKPLRVHWVSPPTDAALVPLLEDLGGCIAGTDYLINHAFIPFGEGDPLDTVAESCARDRLVGPVHRRAERIVEDARRYRAEGVIISGIFGASHCPWDEKVISGAVREKLEIPVLSFDVPFSPGKLSEQVTGRMESFMDLLRNRRGITLSITAPSATVGDFRSDPMDYFRNSIAVETDEVRRLKRQGRGIVGIYCEYTPRDLILAAGALPVCLCGASRRTIPPAETVLPANLCPLIKSSFGYILTGRCPFFMISDLVVAETTCDGKKKMYELIADRRPQHILELTQKPDEKEACTHWRAEVAKLKIRLEQVFDTQITHERMRSAIHEMNAERNLLRQVMMLGAEELPVLSGTEIAGLRYRVSGLPGHREMLGRILELADERRRAGEYAAPANTPRVIVSGCPMSKGTLKVVETIEDSGGLVVVQETCSGWKPLDPVREDGDPLEAIADRHFGIPCSCMTPNTGRLELLRELADTFSADAVVELVWQACHTYSVESFTVSDFVKNELGLSYLKVETDYSNADRERLALRIQTLLSMV
ncbi:hypothetical protein GF402_08575 [Candidatus Fermentibacteria bacterium]|nr:hypothetical protein [Candidatus Fermentibacteria bacterium]